MSRHNSDSVRRMQGCFQVKEEPIFQLDDYKFFTCPSNLRDPGWGFIITMYSSFKKGINPFGLALIDTPNKFIEICNVIDHLSEKLKEKEKQSGKQGRHRNNH